MAFPTGTTCRVCSKEFMQKGLTAHDTQDLCRVTSLHCFGCCKNTLLGKIPNSGNFEIVFTNHKAAPTAEPGPKTMFHG